MAKKLVNPQRNMMPIPNRQLLLLDLFERDPLLILIPDPNNYGLFPLPAFLVGV